MNSCLIRIGTGFGLAAGAGLAYLLVTDEVARVAILTLATFILGGVVVGAFVVLAIFAHARALSAGRQQTTYNYPAIPPGGQAQFPYNDFPPALQSPPREWAQLPRETVDQDGNQFVA